MHNAVRGGWASWISRSGSRACTTMSEMAVRGASHATDDTEWPTTVSASIHVQYKTQLASQRQRVSTKCGNASNPQEMVVISAASHPTLDAQLLHAQHRIGGRCVARAHARTRSRRRRRWAAQTHLVKQSFERLEDGRCCALVRSEELGWL